MKTTYRKLQSANLLQVSNLTFDPCFKVKWGNHTVNKCLLSSFSMGPRYLEYENNLYKIMACAFPSFANVKYDL